VGLNSKFRHSEITTYRNPIKNCRRPNDVKMSPKLWKSVLSCGNAGASTVASLSTTETTKRTNDLCRSQKKMSRGKYDLIASMWILILLLVRVSLTSARPSSLDSAQTISGIPGRISSVTSEWHFIGKLGDLACPCVWFRANHTLFFVCVLDW
jgi:hypothetical protein